MNLKRHIIYFFILTATCYQLQAQAVNYRFVNYGTKDGLPDKFIYTATQDKKGYMWLGTGTGLYRYDGHSFKYYRSPLDKPGNTIANILQAIMTDDGGNLWLGSYTSLQWYNPEKNIFWQPDYSKPAIKKLFSDYIVNFSKGQYTWISTNKNFVYRFNKKDSSFLSLASRYPSGASVTSISTIEANNYLYDFHPEAIYVFTLEGNFVNAVKHGAGDLTNSFYAKDENAFYISSFTSGLLRFDITRQSFSKVAPQNNNLKVNNLLSVVRDDAGNFYLGGHSLFILNPEKNYFQSFYTTEEKNEFSITASKVVNIFTDREKNIWFCSHSGLSMLPWQNSQVKTIHVGTEPFGAFPEPGTGNMLLVNTSSAGLLHVDVKTGNASIISNPSEPDVLKKRITGLITAPDSSIYVSDDKHFFKYDPAAKKLIPYLLKDQNGNPVGPVSRTVTGSNKNIYIGSENNGFYIWHYPSGGLIHYNKEDVVNDAIGEKDNIMMPCLTDSKQNIWFTASSGVYQYNQAENKYYHYSPPAGNSDVAVMGPSQYIAEDKNGHYWIATYNNGLYELYFDGGKENWKNYTVSSGIGLPADYCTKIKQSPGDSTLWISNISGLLKFDPVQKRVLSIFSMQNGFSQEGGGYGFTIFSNNLLAQLFYGKVNILDLKAYRQNTFKPAVVFNSVKVMDEEKVFQPDGSHLLLKLNSRENFLQFEFAALVFNNANKNQYAYKLEGADKDWVYCGQTNAVSYSALKPGTYTFKVKAANNDGYWGNESTVKIIIRQPFYFRWWFFAAGVLLFSGLIFWWNRYRINQTKKEEKLKATFQQQIAETEMKALRAQMNPHFIFNSLNSIQKYIFKNEHFEASQYLTKFSRLIRLILDHSNQNTIPLSSELDLLKLYIEMESLRFDNKFDYAIHVDDNLNAETVELPSMLIQPYVENAIWHGLLHLPAGEAGKENRGKLEVHFSKDDNNGLSVMIDDNGIGREKAAELKSKQVLKKKSYGMQISEERIAIINRMQNINATCTIIDKKNEAGMATGTRVMLHIPVKPLTN